MLYFRLYFDKKLLQAGVTKDDFHKFEVEAMQRRAPMHARMHAYTHTHTHTHT